MANQDSDAVSCGKHGQNMSTPLTGLLKRTYYDWGIFKKSLKHKKSFASWWFKPI